MKRTQKNLKSRKYAAAAVGFDAARRFSHIRFDTVLIPAGRVIHPWLNTWIDFDLVHRTCTDTFHTTSNPPDRAFCPDINNTRPIHQNRVPHRQHTILSPIHCMRVCDIYYTTSICPAYCIGDERRVTSGIGLIRRCCVPLLPSSQRIHHHPNHRMSYFDTYYTCHQSINQSISGCVCEQSSRRNARPLHSPPSIPAPFILLFC